MKMVPSKKREAKPIMATSTAVHSITNTTNSLSVDQRRRSRNYLISMTIRTVCFITAIIVHNPWRPYAIGGAILLPYVAVVAANAGIAGPKVSNAMLHARRKSLEQ